MNIIQIQDDLKNFSENQLINEMQRPSGSAPQFLVLSEINRRRRVKSEFDAANMRDEPSVAQEAVASAGVPAQGIMGMQKAMAPRSESSLSAPIRQGIGMKQGGDITRTIEYLNASSDKTRKELDDIAKKIELNQDNPFQSFDKEIEAKKKEISDFSKMGTKDFSKMSMEELLETRNRMRDLGIGKKEGGVVYAREGLSLGERNFNYGNIRPGADFIGETGANKGYATFKNPLYGGRAVSRLIDTYRNKYGINTIDSFIDRYAPAGDNTKEARAGYKKFLSDKTGLGVGEEFDLEKDKANLMQGIFEFETGKGSPFSQQDINAMIASSKLNDPDKVADLLEFSPASDDGGIMTAAASNLTSDFKFPDGRNYGARDKSEKSFKDFVNQLPKNYLEQKVRRPSYEELIFGQAKDLEDQKEDKSGDESSGIFQDYILGKKYGGKEKGIVDFIDEFVAGPTTKRFIQEKRDIAEQEIEKQERGIIPDEKESEIAKLKKLVFGESTDDTDKALDLEGGVAEGISEITDKELDSIEPKKPLPPSGPAPKKAPTLDDQLVAMQEELKKGREQDKWLSIAQAGLSIMSSDKPTLSGALGEGAGVGLQAYRDAQERYQEGVVDLLNARAKLAKNKSAFGLDDALGRVIGLTNTIANLEEQRTKLVEFPSADNADRIAAIDQELRQARELRDKLQKSYTGISPIKISKNERQGIGAV